MVKSVVEDFGLFVFTDDGKYFYSESFSRRMNAKDAQRKTRAEAGKAAAQKRWKEKAETEDPPSNPQTEPQTPAPRPAPVTQGQGKADNKDYLKRFFGQANQANLEVLLMNFGLKPNEMTVLRNVAKDVVAEWELQDRPHSNYTDWSQHLISLMRIKVKELKTKGATAQTPPTPADYDYGGGFGSKDV